MKTFLLALSLLFATSCACKDMNSTACIVTHAVVDCTEGTIVANAPGFIPLIGQLVAMITGAGGTFNWSDLESKLVGLSLKDAACIAAALEADLTRTPPTSARATAAATVYQAGWAHWVSSRFAAGTKFKLPGGVTL